MARLTRNWFDGQGNRKLKPRKTDWNGGKNPGKLWWGSYENTRFNRVKYNHQKIVRRCSNNVITFKCRSTGSICGDGGSGRAWTHSAWHATIRLCVKKRGFFGLDGKLSLDLGESAGTLVHEVSHNINAIGDKKVSGETMRSDEQVQRLAKDHPSRASWNAYNYHRFAVSR